MPIIAGEYLLEVEIDKEIVLNSATYKIIKSSISRSCPGFEIPYSASRGMAISPLIRDNQYILPYKVGWLTKYEPKPTYRLKGSFMLRVSWAGYSSWRYARMLVKCLTDSNEPLFNVVSTRIEKTDVGLVGLLRLRYLTPAQYKFRGVDGRHYILSVPSVSRILKPGLEILGLNSPEVYKDIDYYTGITNLHLDKATVYLDQLKPTNWALTGELTIAISNEAPQNIIKTIATAARLINYTGSGKSRLEGLGQILLNLF